MVIFSMNNYCPNSLLNFSYVLKKILFKGG